MCQDVTMFTTFPIKLKLFHSKISCYIKFPSVPVPNTVHRLFRMTSHPRSFPSIPTAQQGNQGPEEQLHVTGGLWRAQLWDSSIIWQSQKYFCISLRGHHEKREHPIPLQVMECYLTESVFQTGDCKHCWVVLFHFLPLLPWLMVAVGSLCAHCTEHCLHPRTSSAWEAMLGHIVPGWQVCWAPTMSHLNGPGFMVIQRSLLGFSSPKACQKNHRRAKQRPQDSPFPGGRQKPKYGIGLGFMPCLLKEIPPHSPLPSLLPLAASFSWCLGTGLHSAP